jgi:hypothetical protein
MFSFDDPVSGSLDLSKPNCFAINCLMPSSKEAAFTSINSVTVRTFTLDTHPSNVMLHAF